MSSHRNHFDDIMILFFLNLNLPLLNRRILFLQSSISDLLKYLTPSNLSAELPQVTKLSIFLRTISKTSAFFELLFSAFKTVHNYVRSTDSQETDQVSINDS
jgi:hypothetical protein